MYALSLKTSRRIAKFKKVFKRILTKCASNVLNYYKIPTEDLIVIHDDLDIPFGFFKIQKGTGPKAHNGLLSIYEALHSKDFIHVRIGVESREQDRSMPGKNYVLSSFTDEEENRLQTVIGQAVQELLPLSKGN